MNKHWSVDTTELEKNPEQLAIWKLEQQINWGIGEVKISKKNLLKYWDKIDIDPYKRRALALALS
ncbi:MAG: hypothetical protein HYT48_02550 [Candidatus Vogelbacteria bacterium]|nr:hypothetical protein [Candidatus Vogelbacteria bacterium]